MYRVLASEGSSIRRVLLCWGMGRCRSYPTLVFFSSVAFFLSYLNLWF